MRIIVVLLMAFSVLSCSLPHRLAGTKEYTLNINKVLKEDSCYRINNTVNKVVSEQQGDVKFTYNTSDFLEANLHVSCTNGTIKQVIILSSCIKFWADTGRHKRQITVFIKVGSNTYRGTGESEWVNALFDVSGKRSERSRREALQKALENALLNSKI